MKKTVLLQAFLLVLSLLCAVSCAAKTAYKTGISVSALTEATEALIPLKDGYDAADEDYLTFYFASATTPEEWTVKLSSPSADLNEFGIFRMASEKDAAVFAETVKTYVADMKATNIPFVKTYAPAEVEKLEGAEVKVLGRYVVYLFLNEIDRTAVWGAIEGLLKE